MSKAKAKNDVPTLSKRRFTFLWALSYTPFWMALWTLLEFREYRPYQFNIPAFTGVIVVITLLSALFQSLIAKRFFKRSMPEWFLVSGLGAGLAVFAFSTAINADLLSSAAAMLIPIALIQTLWLWSRIKSGWLWLLAALMAVPLFVFPFRNHEVLWQTGFMPLVILLLGFIQGGIQAVVMRYLWTQPQETRNETPSIAAEELAHQQAEALAHQQAVEHLNPYETPEATRAEEHERLATQETMGEMESR